MPRVELVSAAMSGPSATSILIKMTGLAAIPCSRYAQKADFFLLYNSGKRQPLPRRGYDDGNGS